MSDPTGAAVAAWEGKLPSHIFVGFDWKQAELYMLSLFSRDRALLAALESGDVHTSTITGMYGVDPADVTPKQRDLAKVINYALPYSAFDIDATVSNIVKKAPWTTRAQAVEALERYIRNYSTLYEWSGQALLDWFDDEGWVTYLLGARKRVPYPDYQKRVDASMRRSQPGRVALNTYGQNSVGLLLKLVLQGIFRDPFLRESTAQHLPVFDAHTFLVRTDRVAEVMARVEALATPVLRCGGFEVRMRTDWKASARSWGDMKPIPNPPEAADPPCHAWEPRGATVDLDIPLLEPNHLNPFG